jgi:hypothetical protein
MLMVQSDAVSIFLRDYIKDEINLRVEQDIDLVSVRIRPLHAGIELKGVSITDANDVLALIPKVDIRFSLNPSNSFIREIIVERPLINVNLETLVLPETDQNEKMSEFPFSVLRINQANISIQQKGNTIKGVNFNLHYNNGNTDIWTEENTLLTIDERNFTVYPFHLTEVFVKPRVLNIKDLNIQTSAFDVVGNLNIDNENLTGNLSIKMPLQDFYNSEKLKVDGLLNIDILPRGTISDPTVSFRVASNQVKLWRQGKTREYNYIFSDVKSDLYFENNKIHLKSGSMKWAGGDISFFGWIDSGSKDVSLQIASDKLYIRKLAQDMDISKNPWLDMTFSADVHLLGNLDPLKFNGDINIIGRTLKVAGGDIKAKNPLLEIPSVELKGKVNLTKLNFKADIFDARLPLSRGTFSVDYQFPFPNNMIVDFNFPTMDFSVLQPLGGSDFKGLGTAKGKISGPLKELAVTAEISATDFSVIGLDIADNILLNVKGATLKKINLEIIDAYKGNTKLEGDMNITFGSQLYFDSEIFTKDGQAQDLMGIFFTPLDVDAKVKGKMVMKGPTSNLVIDSDFDLSEISVWGEKFDTGRMLINQNNKYLTIEELSLQRNDGLGSALMRGSRKNGNNNFEVIVGGLPVEYLSFIIDQNWPIRGKVDLFAKIQGESFVPSGTIIVRDVWYGTEPLGDGSILFHEQEEHQEIIYQGEFADLLNFHGASGYSLDENYKFHFVCDEFPVHILSPQSYRGELVEGILSAVGSVQQNDSELSLLADVNNLALEWNDRNVHTPNPWGVTWSPTYFEIEPVWFVGTGNTNFSMSGTEVAGVPNFEAVGDIDLRVLEMFSTGFKRSTGIANIDAKYDENGIFGKVNIKDGFLDTEWFPHSIEGISTNFVVNNDGYIIDDFTARVGGGRTEIDGFIKAEQAVPENFNLSLNFQEGQIRLLDFLPPVYGDADLKLTGLVDYPMLSGDVVVKEMNFTERIDWEDAMLTFDPVALSGSTAEDEPGYFSYDIDLVADNTIRVRNNLADVYASADLKFIGDIAKPGMSGTIRLADDGRAIFKERDFDIRRGELRYDDPYTFDPNVDILMTTTVSTQEQDISIDYHVTGLYSNWQTFTTSSPALPQADINALLIFGMTTEEIDLQGGLGTALLVEGGDLVVSKFGVVQRFNEVSEGIFQSELLHLDRIDVVSGPTDRNSAYVSSALRLLLEKDIGDNKFRLEQNLQEASDVFVSFERRVAERLYIRTYWTSEQQGGYLNNNYGALGTEFEVKWELD